MRAEDGVNATPETRFQAGLERARPTRRPYRHGGPAPTRTISRRIAGWRAGSYLQPCSSKACQSILFRAASASRGSSIGCELFKSLWQSKLCVEAGAKIRYSITTRNVLTVGSSLTKIALLAFVSPGDFAKNHSDVLLLREFANGSTNRARVSTAVATWESRGGLKRGGGVCAIGSSNSGKLFFESLVGG